MVIKQVDEVIRYIEQAISAYDFDQLKTVLAPDFMLIEHGYPEDRDSLIMRFKKLQGDGVVIKYELTDLVVHEEGETAWATYTNNGTFFKPGLGETKRVYVESVFLRRDDDGWKETLMHVTYLPEETS